MGPRRLWVVLLLAVIYYLEWIACAVGPTSDSVEAEPGLDYQKLLAKLEILDTKITRVEVASREQFSSLESKLDRIMNLVDGISQSMHATQKDIGTARAEIQLFQNESLEQLEALAGSVSIIESLLVEGHRQKQTQPVRGESIRVFATKPTTYDSCDFAPGNVSRVEKILPDPGFGAPFQVFCDQDYAGGGWIVIQNRFNGSVDFYRGWKEYKNGFGNLNGEFWLGLDKLHALTYSAPYELHVLLEDFKNSTVVAKYTQFAVGNEHESFAITKLGDYSGTAGDGLSYHRNSKFSTMDINNDVAGNNGGVDWTGAWWYRKGHFSNLNGQYLSGKVDHTKFHGKGMTWNPFRGDDYSLKRSRMMVKRISI
ncbi:microfibril-associated glycoprotein 4-like [Armigeres subalbatus]|uniref:microfibril-associated glycoprotein 4-like n=1 Tax=Armigeres subalbatus TaxID=124917 RepID=UPI002ED67153